MKTGELSRLTGMSIAMLHYYEVEGLIQCLYRIEQTRISRNSRQNCAADPPSEIAENSNQRNQEDSWRISPSERRQLRES